MKNVLRKSARVLKFPTNTELRRTLKCTGRAPKKGDIGVVVDYSDSHGLCYGLVFPNTKGFYGRTDSLPIRWFDPKEVSFKLKAKK
jgi:hypothetical protein